MTFRNILQNLFASQEATVHNELPIYSVYKALRTDIDQCTNLRQLRETGTMIEKDMAERYSYMFIISHIFAYLLRRQLHKKERVLSEAVLNKHFRLSHSHG